MNDEEHQEEEFLTWADKNISKFIKEKWLSNGWVIFLIIFTMVFSFFFQRIYT